MVLTNFECWAHGGANHVNGHLDNHLSSRNSVDLFNPRTVMEACRTGQDPTTTTITNTAEADVVKKISHISSNGYYGFSYVNAAHIAAAAEFNNNVNIMPHANCVNGTAMNSPQMIDNEMTVDNDLGNHAAATARNQSTYANVAAGGNMLRCKKRFFLHEDDFIDTKDNSDSALLSAKRCRFDSSDIGMDDVAAQYCNDFFRMNATQIGTQTSLMETEEYHHQHNNGSPAGPEQLIIPSSHLQQVDGIPLAIPPIENNSFNKNKHNINDDTTYSFFKNTQLTNITSGGGNDSQQQSTADINSNSNYFPIEQIIINAATATNTTNNKVCCCTPIIAPSSQTLPTSDLKRAIKRNVAFSCSHCTQQSFAKFNKSDDDQHKKNNVSHDVASKIRFIASDSWSLLPSEKLDQNKEKPAPALIPSYEKKEPVDGESLLWQKHRHQNVQLNTAASAPPRPPHPPSPFHSTDVTPRYDHQHPNHSTAHSVVPLETMFSLTHGGGDHQLWRQILAKDDENFCDEI